MGLLCWLSLMLSVTYAECHIWALNAECHIWALYGGWHHAECHYAEFHCAECRGTLLLTRSTSRLVIWNHWWNNFWLFQFLLHHQFSFFVLLLEKTQNWSSFFIKFQQKIVCLMFALSDLNLGQHVLLFQFQIQICCSLSITLLVLNVL